MTMQYTLVEDEDGASNLTVFRTGDAPLSAHSSHPNFEEILAKVLADDETALDLFDVAKTAGLKFERLTERVTTANGRLYLDGEEVHDALADQVVRFLQEGVEDWKPLVAFFENVQANPSFNSRNQLYGWLTREKLTITEDGLIVGYKGVAKVALGEFLSIHAGNAIVNGEPVEGHVPNPLGGVVEMSRAEVDDNTNADCSYGLHVGTYGYASGFAQGAVLEVHVHPADVVSVPHYDTNKMRVCRYKVVQAIDQKYDAAVLYDYDEDYDEGEGEGEDIAEASTVVQKVTKAVKKAVAKEVRVGDVYEDTDKRRAGRTLKVKSLDGDTAVAESQDGKTTKVKVERLQSRKYKLVKRGRKRMAEAWFALTPDEQARAFEGSA